MQLTALPRGLSAGLSPDGMNQQPSATQRYGVALDWRCWCEFEVIGRAPFEEKVVLETNDSPWSIVFGNAR